MQQLSRKIINPMITVITAVLNAEDFIESTIASVLDYDYDNIRYIIIDGGSTDGTVDIIRKYEERIAFWCTEKDSGIYDAMNKGWSAAAEGSFIIFLGAGDRLMSLPPDMCRFGNDEVIYGRTLLGDKQLFVPSIGFRLKLYNSLHHQSLLVNKSLHPSPPFDTKFRVYADFDLNQRLYKQGVSFRYSEELLTYALPDGVSGRLQFKESLSVIRKNFGIFWTLAASLGYYAMKLVPFFRRLRPFRPIGDNLQG